MSNCGQACPYNTLDGCKVKEYNAICPLTNIATPITEYQITNADRIRAMSDEELAGVITKGVGCVLKAPHCAYIDCTLCILKWLKQPWKENEDEQS